MVGVVKEETRIHVAHYSSIYLIADATDVVQGDKATTYDAIAALQLILAAASGSTSFCGELRRCILNRKSQMFTAPIICALVLLPYRKARKV